MAEAKLKENIRLLNQRNKEYDIQKNTVNENMKTIIEAKKQGIQLKQPEKISNIHNIVEYYFSSRDKWNEGDLEKLMEIIYDFVLNGEISMDDFKRMLAKDAPPAPPAAKRDAYALEASE
tara:strand:+ start:473 stop:832 length:360 start_codon:yes stop_codon:yes gene_type:complete